MVTVSVVDELLLPHPAATSTVRDTPAMTVARRISMMWHYPRYAALNQTIGPIAEMPNDSGRTPTQYCPSAPTQRRRGTWFSRTP